ncbi:MAG: NYN domain-containing protein [Terracidiphilus sp.]
MKKMVLMIDGGYLRVASRKAGIHFSPDFIEAFSKICSAADEELFRSLYYDCAPYQGRKKLPVSVTTQTFSDSDQWLTDLAKKDLMAVRLGILKFRGYKLKKTRITGIAALTDADFVPVFEQKGVDMRIGLDIASYSVSKCVDRIGLVTADTDCVPAMKMARKSGVQVVLVSLPGTVVPSELAQHSDFVRTVAWPPSQASVAPCHLSS